jgi:hypothetical protein
LALKLLFFKILFEIFKIELADKTTSNRGMENYKSQKFGIAGSLREIKMEDKEVGG